jgi:two-component system response regulator DctR
LTAPKLSWPCSKAQDKTLKLFGNRTQPGCSNRPASCWTCACPAQLLAKGMAQAWPVIFLTGHADVPTAVDSVKRGAFDFCEKPFSDNALVDRVEQALALSQERLTARQTQQRLQSRLLELTERERDVMRLVVEGLPNKLIADQLDISVRTVEVHRARVFDKMEVKSAVELANLMRQLA